MTVLDANRRLSASVAVRALLIGLAWIGLLSCGGGGGGDAGAPRAEGVYTGFAPQVPGLSLEQALNWSSGGESGSDGGAGGGIGAGGDGDGGVGAGGDFGQFRNALLIVRYPDGTPVGNGQALTDAATGMVTIVPRAGYQGPLYLELQGGNGATYYEEGKDSFVDFPAGQVIRAIVPRIDKNIGITPFSDAAYRLLVEGSTPERAADGARPTAAEIQAANTRVLAVLNQQFPVALQVDDITRLPYIKSSSIAANSIPIDARGRYGLVNGAFSKQAAMYNAARTAPTLDAVAQLGADLLDGVLDGMNGSQPATAAAARTYDPNTLTGELSSALAEQSYRFGTEESRLALPKVLNFGNSRYEGYLFDASITPDGRALDTVAGWVGGNSKNFSIGQPFDKLPQEARAFGVFGNLGHGALYFKANAGNSQGKVYVVGDNVNGELGLGRTGSTNAQAVEISLPGIMTHVAGGYAHTVARFADGAVYSWGDNSFAQLGTVSTASSTTPVRVPLPRGALAVAATNTASYALLDDGSVYAWGSGGGFGLLGDGNKNSVSSTPVPVSALSSVVQISARDNDVAVLRKDGTVWHWGSFPADATGFVHGDVLTPYAGGSPLPVPLTGLPAGVAVRKLLTEQGLFAALMGDGTVYAWGVHFDLTANTILRDLSATRVLNLPPIRDMMPGGFIGYGARPFDRLTALGVDYRGGMWKIRGRVAEQFDPANPTQQRRPQGQTPRTDCASCHLFLSDWPLTPEAPTSSATCQPPATIHGSGSTSLIHAETECQSCHNPARNPPIAAFPKGWLTCVKPTTLPPRSTPVAPAIITASCTPSANHSFTPPGTVCASCHNSIIARPLNDPTLNCAQPPSTALPTLKTTAAITTAVNNAVTPNVPIASGASTTDTTPALSGTLSAGLAAGQSLRVLRNSVPVGTATVSGTGWNYTDAATADGVQVYTVRVEAGTAFGAMSNSYTITIDTTAPTQAGNVAQIADDFSGALANAATTGDTTPTISGSLSAALGTGESLQLLRNGSVVATLTPAGTSWSYTEPVALTQATYSYAARVIDAATNVSTAVGSTRTVTVNTTYLLASAATTLATINNVTPSANAVPSNSDNTPTLAGTIQRALGSSPAEVVRIYRGGAAVGTATVSGLAWSYTSAALADGTYTFSARIEQAAAATIYGAPSSTVSDPIDTSAPTQTVTSFTATSDAAPALPIATQTSDPTPVFNARLNAGLGAGESLAFTRSGFVAPIASFTSATTAGSCAGLLNCFEFTYASGLSIPTPPASYTAEATPALPSAGNLPNHALSASTASTYTARIVDAAGNASASQPTLSFRFDYLPCDQARANSAAGGTHTTISAAAAPATTCGTCHRVLNSTATGTIGSAGTVPAGSYVAVPSSSAAYWCRRPG